jgi:proteasome lid subunit RPN8/RPN11
VGAPTALTEGQQQAFACLRSIAHLSGGDLLIDAGSQRMDGNWLELRVWLSSENIPASTTGIPLAQREPVDISIPEDFPFRRPGATAGHNRFAGQPHVQWGKVLCLYGPGEWDPSAGMAGFLRRLLAFYQHLALGTLGGPQAPWDPPVAYADEHAGCMVIRADLVPSDRGRTGSFFRWAVGVQLDADRADVVEWLEISADGCTADQLVDGLMSELRDVRTRTSCDDAFLVPAVILPEPIAWEYPESVIDLLIAVDSVGTEPQYVLGWLALTTFVNREMHAALEPGEPDAAYLLVRAPADKRFTTADPQAHFAAWRLVPEDEAVLLGDEAGASPEHLETWLQNAETRWAIVYDARAEAVIRRDVGRPVEKLRGSRVLVLGCGALGAPIAEHCVRAGAAEVHVVDWGEVNPGILVRQPYEDVNIGLPKAKALEHRLSGIRPETFVYGTSANILPFLTLSQSDLSEYDLVIDATADRPVAVKIERLRRERPHCWPDLVSVSISQTARYGVATVTPRGSTGAGIDLFRRLALAASEDPALADIYREFFPAPEERIEFVPERGCSGLTFIGSNTDVTALAAQLLDTALANVGPGMVQVSAAGEAEYIPCERTVGIVRLGSDHEQMTARVRLTVPHDRVVADHSGAYQVRIQERAMAQLRQFVAETTSAYTAQADRETGGLLLGQFDDACGVAWVSEATRPPDGSLGSPLFMVINTPAAREHVLERSRQTGGLTSFMGLWHTHPDGPASPSETDIQAMRKLIAETPGHSLRILLMVLGLAASGSRSATQPGADWGPDIYAEVFAR